MIDSVPLIQNANDAQQINASIIAMKKASRELDEKIVKLNSLNSELDKKIALLDSGLNKEIEDRKEAINSLDVSSVGGSGKYISAISETDGKISATASEITSSVSSGNSQPVTSGGVASALASYDKFEFIQTDSTDKIYRLGNTINANNYQAFTNIYLRGGRVDNVFGEGFITLYGTQYVWSRLLANLGGPIEIIVTLESGQMIVYAKIPTLSTLLFNVASSSNFTVDIQEVSQISGTVVWNNAWETVVTFSNLADYAKQISNVGASYFGYSNESYVPIEDFMDKVCQMSGGGNYIIKFVWAYADTFFLHCSDGSNFQTAGATLIGCIQPNSYWVNTILIFLSEAGEVFTIRLNRGDGAGMASTVIKLLH